MADPNPLSRPGYFPSPPSAARTSSKPIARWIWFAVAGFVAVLAVLSIPVVRLARTASRTAHASVDALHDEMRRGDVQAIFNNSDPGWQNQVGMAKTQHLFGFLHEKMGDPQTCSLTGWSTEDDAQGSMVTWTFSTTFSKGEGTETVTMHKSGNVWRLWKYSVKSTLIAPGEYQSEPAAQPTVH